MEQLTINDITDSNTRDGKIALIYVRDRPGAPPTNQQSKSCLNALVDNLGYDIDNGTRSSILQQTNTAGDRDTDTEHGAGIIRDDTATHPSGIERLLEVVRRDPDPNPDNQEYEWLGIDDVIIPALDTISDSLQDVYAVIHTINSEDTTVHTVNDDLQFEKASTANTTLKSAAEVELRRETKRVKRKIVPNERENQTGGRPPIGYTYEGGRRRPGDDYYETKAALEAVDTEMITKAEAARQTGHSRSAITRALQYRRHLYGLDEADDK